MSYRVRRVDENQSSIVEQFRRLRCKVLILSEVGKGCPDLLVAIPCGSDNRYWLTLIEVKNGKQPPSAKKLTIAEKKFHEEWQDLVYIIENEEEVIELVKSVWG